MDHNNLGPLQTNMPVSVIFGGSGFVGKHLTERLKNLGHYVVICDIENSEENLADEFYICDVRKPINLNIGKKPNHVFNFAAVHRTPGHPDKDYFETNLSGALHVTKWCENVGANTILFTSSISVYGLQQGTINESSAPNPKSPYGCSKLFAEEIHKLWQSKSMLERRLVIVRPAVIFGPGECGNFTRLARALKLGYFLIPSGREILKPSGWIDDLVDSMLFTLDRTDSVVTYNFAFPKTYSIGEICDAFVLTCKAKKPKAIPLTRLLRSISLPFNFYRRLSARIDKLSHSVEISPNYLITTGFEWNYDLESALTKWSKTNAIEGIFSTEK